MGSLLNEVVDTRRKSYEVSVFSAYFVGPLQDPVRGDAMGPLEAL